MGCWKRLYRQTLRTSLHSAPGYSTGTGMPRPPDRRRSGAALVRPSVSDFHPWQLLDRGEAFAHPPNHLGMIKAIPRIDLGKELVTDTVLDKERVVSVPIDSHEPIPLPLAELDESAKGSAREVRHPVSVGVAGRREVI